MAVTTTSAPQQQVAMPAVDLRQALGVLVSAEGVRTATDLAVAQRASGANMSVDVAAGSAYIADDHATGGGFYSFTLAVATNVTVTGSDPTNPRIDRVVIRVRDQALGDAANDIGPVVVAGTPTGGATLANLSGAAAVPASSLLVANVLVPAASSSVTTANIDTTVRPTIGLASGLVKLAPDPPLTAAAASFDFTGIPAGFSHLRVEINGRGDTAATATGVNVRFNNDTAANYYYQVMSANATSVSASQALAQSAIKAGDMPANTSASGFGGGLVIHIPGYSTATLTKGVYVSNSAPTGTTTGTVFIEGTAGVWNSGVAINRVTILPTAGNFVIGTRCTLYGEA